MSLSLPNRRHFLGGTAAAALASGLSWKDLAAAPGEAHRADEWLDKLTGSHRCLFDFPEHGAGFPLLHMYNYLNTYKSAYGTKPGEVNAVGTFYYAGPTSSFPLGFNDAMWARYKFGTLLNLTDPKTGKPSERNMFNQPMAGDPVLLGGQPAASSIENLQKAGALFLVCNNALMLWVSQLAAGGGSAATIENDLRTNTLPGVVIVPAMVIAIEKAQSKGIAYNKQG